MSKRFTWEVEKTSLILRVTDGAKETTWKIRKNMKLEDVSQTLEDMWVALQGGKTLGELAQELVPPVGAAVPWDGRPMLEAVRTVDAEELAELQRYKTVQADSEEASRAAQAARVAQLNVGAKWFEAEDDIYPFDSVQVPDYDTGEIQ